MAKSDRMYKSSPSIKRGEDGSPGISKPSQADAEDMGIAGDNNQGDPAEMAMNVEQLDQTHGRHQTEMKDMHKRHQDEAKDMHKRHAKEVGKHYGKSEKE